MDKRLRSMPTDRVGIGREPVRFVFYCHAWPKDRGRAMINKKTGKPFIYKDPRNRAYELQINCESDAQYPFSKPLEGDLIVDMVFTLKDRVHGDKDNLEKAVLDGMEGVAYKNDKQVRGGSQQFIYFDELDDDEPKREKIEVTIRHRMSPKEMKAILDVVYEEDDLEPNF